MSMIPGSFQTKTTEEIMKAIEPWLSGVLPVNELLTEAIHSIVCRATRKAAVKGYEQARSIGVYYLNDLAKMWPESSEMLKSLAEKLNNALRIVEKGEIWKPTLF